MKFLTAVVLKGVGAIEATIESESISLYYTNPENEEQVVVVLTNGKIITLFADKHALDAIMKVQE